MSWEQSLWTIIPVVIAVGLVWWMAAVLFLGLHRGIRKPKKPKKPLLVIGPHNSGRVLYSTWCWHLVQWHGTDTLGWVHKLDVKRAPPGTFQ